MFQIWQNPRNQVVIMLNSIHRDDQPLLCDAGLELVKELPTNNEKEAKRLFEEWVHDLAPNTTINRQERIGFFIPPKETK